MKVLVTGGTGLVGSHVLNALVNDNRHEIVAIRRETSSLVLVDHIKDKITWHVCDVTDIIGLKSVAQNIDVVIHMAAKVSLSPKDKKAVYAINAEGTANIVNCCIANNIPKLIYISSASAFGGSRGRLIHEDDHWVDKPLKSFYAHSKYLGEQEVWRGAAEGLKVNIVAPTLVIGAGKWNAPPAIISLMDKGMSSYPMGSNGVVDARDVASIIIALVDSSKINQKYICSSENLSLKQFSDLLSSALNREPVSKAIDGAYLKLIMILAWLNKRFSFSKLLFKDYLIISNQKLEFDNQKSINDLEMDYIKVNKSITDTIEAYKLSKAQGKSYALPLD